jgi:hypothetical protein
MLREVGSDPHPKRNGADYRGNEDNLLDEPNREIAAYQLRFDRCSRRVELR